MDLQEADRERNQETFKESLISLKERLSERIEDLDQELQKSKQQRFDSVVQNIEPKR